MKIKNRLIAGVLCLLMVLSCVSGLTSCNDEHDHEDCTHQWGEWSTTTEATCTAVGTKERKCSECGETEKATIAAIGHDWNEATCSTPKTCKNCSVTEGSASAHSYTVETVKDEALKSAATCTSAAVYYKSCSCGAVSTNDADTFTNGNTVAHSFTVETVKDEALKSAATTENAAVYYKSCACGAISTNDADTFTHGTPLGHTHSFNVEAVKDEALKSAANCESAAVYFKSCSCGEVSENETEIFTNGSALGHKDGNTDHICDNGCNKNDMGICTDSDEDTDHVCDYGCGKALNDCKDVSGDNDHNCDVCGKSGVSPHDFGDATCGTPATCSECGATTGTTAAHIYNQSFVKTEALKSVANCENAAVYYKSCSCGAISTNEVETFTNGSALGHKDENTDHTCDNECGKKDMGTCTDSAGDGDHICDYGCGKTFGGCSDTAGDGNHACDECGGADVSGHSYTNATCGMPKTCSECGATTGNTLDHVDENHDHICDNGCGKNDMGSCADSDEDTDHVCDYGCGKNLNDCKDVSGDNDHNCDVCNKANVTPHDYIENTASATEATCDTAATKHYECNCGDTRTENVGDALGHDITGVEANERQVNGCEYVLVYKCQRGDCGEEVLGETVYHHNYVASITKSATCKEDGEKTLTCACGDSKTDVIEKDETGHNWVAGSAVDGVRTDTCSICQATKTVMVSDSNTASSNASNLANTDVQLKVDDDTNANIQLGQGVADAIGDKDITISAGVVDEDKLKDMGVSDEQLGQIGANTVYDFNIKDGDGSPISDFGENNFVTITLPYTLSDGEDVDSIAVWFISDTCQVEGCDKGENCVDAHKLVSIEATYNNGFVTFKTNHFSIYTVTRLTPAERCALYDHNYAEQIVEGSCTKDGYVLLVCVRCHDKRIKEGTFEKADGHNYSSTTVAATCMESGYVLYDCTDCDHTYKTIINATGHTWGVEDSKEASCVADGYTKYGCDNCDEEYTVTYAKVAHVYTNTVIPATCTADGYTLHDCDNCEYSYTDTYVEALGHEYEFTTWTWAADYSSATLAFVCTHNDEHVMVLNATITTSVVNGTCSNFVKTTYTATVSYDGTDYTDEKIVELGTPDHNFSSDWSKNDDKHWHECVCGEKTDVTEHTFENATTTKVPTCAEAGESTAYCVCGETKVTVIPATGKHNYVEGVCTSCGKEYVDTYYVNLVDSWKNINGFAIKLQNLSYEVKQIDPDLLEALKVIGSVKQIDVAELALYMEDGELGGAAIGEIVIFNGPISDANAVYKFKAVIHEGYVYIKVEHGKENADKTMNIKMSVDSMMESILEEMDIEGETVYVLDFFKDTLIPAVETLVEINSEEANAILEDLFNMIFTFEQQADGSYIATLDYDKLYVLNENLATKPVAEVIDIYFGEGAFDSIVAFANEILDLEVSKIPEYLDEKGLDSADLIARINALAVKMGAPVDYDISDMLNSDELVGVTLGMLIFDVEDRSYADSVNEIVSELRTNSLYAMIDSDSVEDIKDGVKSILDMIAESVSLTFTTNADGMLVSIAIDVDEFTYSDGETEIFLNFNLEIIINGRVDVTWAEIIESIENELVMPEDEMLDNSIESDYHYGFSGYVNYKGQEYEYDYGIRIYARKTLYDKLGYVIFQPDCNGWTAFEACYAEKVYEFILASITVDGENVMILIDEYSGEVVELIETEAGITVVYADGSEKAIDMSTFTDFDDLAAMYTALYFEIFENPEGYEWAFGDYLYYYYNAETKEYSTESHHEYEYEYKFNGDTCEDGCTIITGCKNCDYYDEYTRYWCDYENEVEIDLSEHTSCGGTAIVDRCLLCGNINCVYDMNIKCNMGEGVEEEILGADGEVIGYKYTSTCTQCGLIFVEQEWIEYRSACEYTEYEGLYIYKDDVCIFKYVNEWYNVEHDYEYSVGDDFVDCEQEHKIIVHCTVCGETNEWWTSNHRYESREINLDEYGLCGGYIYEEYCPICDEILHSSVEDWCDWEYVEEIENGHDKYLCRHCGATKIEYVHEGEKDGSCRYERTEIRRYIVNGEEVYSYERTYTIVSHNYQYEYTLNGESCEDGYIVTRYCPDCKYSENYESNGHRCEYREVDLSEYGLCGGYIYEEYCPMCKTVLHSKFNERCKWQYVETTSDGCEKYECRNCGTVKLEYRYSGEKNQNCEYEYTELRVYIVDGKEIYRYENTSIRTSHEYQYEYKMNGASCEDGYTMITTCKDCGDRWTEELYHHNVNMKEGVDLGEFGACYGEYAYYSCACGQEAWVDFYCCANTWTENEYYDDELGKMVYVEARTCSECGLRYEQSYYVVEDEATCTTTSYITVVISIDNTLVFERQYTEVGECHSGYETVTLIGGAGSSCEDGVIITFKCERCEHEDSREVYWHEMLWKESIDLSEFGSVCGGHATLYGCACGERNEMSLEHDLCENGTEGCLLWIEDAITEGQYTINGYNGIWNDSYIYVCSVTDPADKACGYKIRYAYYWLKDENSCMAYRYETWQFGYNEETGTCKYERTFKTGDRMIYHDYEDNSTDHHVRFDCPDCESYYEEKWTYENERCVKYERRASNTLNNGYDKYYEYIEEYAFEENNGESYVAREYWKYIHEDNTESWSENSISKYDGPFGENGREVVSSSCDRNGYFNEGKYAYVWYKGYEYTIYHLRTEGDYWERYDYEYDLEDGCVRTTVYTNSDGEEWEDAEDWCFFYRHETLKNPTCSQNGERYDICVICDIHSDSYSVEPTDHDWVEVRKGWYCCYRCGLENANGVSGDIIMEDLTEKYGNGENYVVGYYAGNDVEFTTYVSLVWDDGREEIVGNVEFLTVDGIRAYAFSKAAVEAWAAKQGFEGYRVKFSFVPVGSDGSFDYGVTFTETMELDTITDDISFVDYIPEGEWVSYEITPSENGVWTFTSDSYFDTYAELYDANGNLLVSDDDDGEENNFLISYELLGGESYTIKVKWLYEERAGSLSLIFANETKAE